MDDHGNDDNHVDYGGLRSAKTITTATSTMSMTRIKNEGDHNGGNHENLADRGNYVDDENHENHEEGKVHEGWTKEKPELRGNENGTRIRINAYIRTCRYKRRGAHERTHAQTFQNSMQARHVLVTWVSVTSSIQNQASTSVSYNQGSIWGFNIVNNMKHATVDVVGTSTILTILFKLRTRGDGIVLTIVFVNFYNLGNLNAYIPFWSQPPFESAWITTAAAAVF